MYEHTETTFSTAVGFIPPDTVFYGPHDCERCGETICKAGREFGSTEFDYPTGPIYPNSQWYLHNCKASEPLTPKR